MTPGGCLQVGGAFPRFAGGLRLNLAGIALRMVFDAGLHVDSSSLGLSERESQIRHMVLWACLITDKYVGPYPKFPILFL